MSRGKILVVDDDKDIGNMEQTVLEKAGFAVVRAYSGTEVISVLKTSTPDLVLLDLMLPGLSGEEVLPQIVSLAKSVPVIIVSAKIDADSKVSMLTEGACDYITKPFDTRELVARIELRMREAGKVSHTLVHGNLEMDDSSHTVTASGVPVQLTRTEYGILKMLMESPEKVITRSEIIGRISSETEDCTESSLKTHVSHLRAKLRAVSGKDHIESVWGIGFKMNSNLN